MDVTWMQKHAPGGQTDMKERLERVDRRSIRAST